MKTAILNLILFCYVFALCKPITPAVNDVIAHTFFKMQHLSTVHFEDGKYHLHSELMDSAVDKKSPLSTEQQGQKDFLFLLSFHILPEGINLSVPAKGGTLLFHGVLFNVLSGITGTPAQPPEN